MELSDKSKRTAYTPEGRSPVVTCTCRVLEVLIWRTVLPLPSIITNSLIAAWLLSTVKWPLAGEGNSLAMDAWPCSSMPTVIEMVWQLVAEPQLPVMVRHTLYCPLPVKVWEGDCSVLVVPSPKSHR